MFFFHTGMLDFHETRFAIYGYIFQTFIPNMISVVIHISLIYGPKSLKSTGRHGTILLFFLKLSSVLPDKSSIFYNEYIYIIIIDLSQVSDMPG